MKRIRVHYDNLSKHGITKSEIEECLRPGNRKYRRKAGRGVYRAICQTFAGRYLELLYVDEPTHRFVFHARDAKLREIKLLKRRGKR
jgi:hypothetical protein